MTRAEFAQLLIAEGFSADMRAEKASVADFMKLAKAIKEKTT